jgi:ribosomal protein L11 methyltransferase
VFVLELECAESDVERISADLFEAGSIGIQEERQPGAGTLLRSWFEEPGDLLDRFRAWKPRLAEEAEHDWEAEAKAAWPAFEVGTQLFLAPEWDESETPRGRVRLTIHPGLALGTGAHPCTQLCIEALERHLTAGDSVLDVGAGSGILMSAALALGASRAAGCDIEPDSVAVARSNLLADGLAPDVFLGSIRAVRHGAFDAAVANINAIVHLSLAAEYARVAPGKLILSGFPDADAEPVTQALLPRGFRLVDRLSDGPWVCLVFERLSADL